MSVRDLLNRRAGAYARLFSDKPQPGDAKIVLDDLMPFCRFGQSAFHPEPRMTDILLGRQEVIDRIIDHARLDREALFVKYNTAAFKPRREPNAS